MCNNAQENTKKQPVQRIEVAQVLEVRKQNFKTNNSESQTTLKLQSEKKNTTLRKSKNLSPV